ncbi:methyl-accepting chemotaxis protein [Psychrosphaera haliotis]|uniref:HAMP domain-containing protein n=1 Tax=Psychrosphaera haliotis TaxID=555083 RepID=A0A6N8F3B5_9GAMM|nr:HAMP domain-containing methyl-accepting chemotaxis protein [Psychrosphaera haliotis]MUH71146.1 HAMP domain-containing protein [Psychrosphaera haliotis]
MKVSMGTSIKQKLLINAVLVASGMVLLLVLLIYSNYKNSQFTQTVQYIDKINRDIMQLDIEEKFFLENKNTEHVDNFNKIHKEVSAQKTEFSQILKEEGFETDQVERFTKALNSYKATFDKLVVLQKTIGLHPKDALYGELRGAVHNIETILKEQNSYMLLVDMLQLRRAEKDFMLRFDEKYLDKFIDGIDTLRNNLSRTDIDGSTQNKIKGLLSDYQVKFVNLVKAQKQIGLNSESGVRGQLAEAKTILRKTQDVMESNISEGIEAKQLQTQVFGFAMFVVLVGIIMSSTFVTSRKVLGPIQQISSTIDAVRNTNDLTQSHEFEGEDELSAMGRQFNSLISDFRELILRVNNAVKTLDEATKSLVSNSTNNQTSLDIQLRETESVAAAVTEMGATIKEIVSNTEDAASKALSSNENAEQGSTQVNMTIESIRFLSDKLDTAVSDVNALAEESKNVGSVLDVIRGIAEQTNLLALNAAIEAARAGEHGRGFAVVADEVRTLAMRTQESTKEIENIVTSLQSRIGGIVSVIDQCQEQGSTSTQRAGEAGEKLVSITQDVKSIMDMNTQIATAIEQQSKVAEEVNQNVVAIRDVADDSFQRAKENAASSENISKQAVILHSFIDKYKV